MNPPLLLLALLLVFFFLLLGCTSHAPTATTLASLVTPPGGIADAWRKLASADQAALCAMVEGGRVAQAAPILGNFSSAIAEHYLMEQCKP